MKPLAYSKKEAEYKNIGWHRTGSEIAYFTTNKKAGTGKSIGPPNVFYTLTFLTSFQYDNDSVYLAHCYPYTYSDSLKHLDKVSSSAHNKNVVRRTTLCKTLAGNPMDMLIITNFQSS